MASDDYSDKLTDELKHLIHIYPFMPVFFLSICIYLFILRHTGISIIYTQTLMMHLEKFWAFSIFFKWILK